MSNANKYSETFSFFFEQKKRLFAYLAPAVV